MKKLLVVLLLVACASAGCFSFNPSDLPGYDSTSDEQIETDMAVDAMDGEDTEGWPDVADVDGSEDTEEEYECTTNGECSDGNPCNGIEFCNIDTHTCEPWPPPDNGFVCEDEPRSICLDGECLTSVCGDGFVDRGGGEFCDPPGEGGCNDECQYGCESDADCSDDGEICNGEEYCDMDERICSRRSVPAEGIECGTDPRRICIEETCQESSCGDGFLDTFTGEECDDGNDEAGDGCESTCLYSCHSAAECNDGRACTIDACDSAVTHTCSYSTAPNTTQCRAAAGACDRAEYCDGTSADCPPDTFQPASFVCRTAAGPCDRAENCTGTSSSCPADAFQPSGTPCNDGDPCTDPDQCDAFGVCSGSSSGLGGAIAMAGGDNHTCALFDSGSASCWGANSYGQLGNGGTGASSTPVSVVDFGSIASISAGRNHTCAVTTSGALKCWGSNADAQLGTGTAGGYNSTPVDVYGMTSGVAAVSCGGNHTCALLTSGGVKCWGNNDYGQIGIGILSGAVTAPQDVSGLTSGAAGVALGYDHSCARMSSGGVKCWGRNNYGQLGDGTMTRRETPVDAQLPSSVTAVFLSSGCYNPCVVTSTGGAMCWGRNNYGQVGDGTTSDARVPVAVSGLSSGVAAMAGGEYHSCARLSAGTVKCWGYNLYGQLGDGTTTRRYTPVDVSLPSAASVLGAGFTHGCVALQGVGSMMCWGYNEFGQLGDGTSGPGNYSTVPVYVSCE